MYFRISLSNLYNTFTLVTTYDPSSSPGLFLFFTFISETPGDEVTYGPNIKPTVNIIKQIQTMFECFKRKINTENKSNKDSQNESTIARSTAEELEKSVTKRLESMQNELMKVISQKLDGLSITQPSTYASSLLGIQTDT